MEFALVLPLLAVFLFGIVQFGIAYDAKQSVNSAAREGARLGALRTTTVPQIQARATGTYGNSAAPGGPPAVNVYGVIVSPAASVQFPAGAGPCASTSPRYEFVRVEVVKPYTVTIPFVPLNPINLTSIGEFKCE